MPGPRSILLVTLHPDHRRALADHLRDLGYRPTVAATASGDHQVDLALVDLTDDALWPVAEDLAGGRLMLIVPDPAALERGFLLGADDCVVEDARIEEIAARCEAVLRRTGEPPPVAAGDPAVYADRRLWINFDSRQVWVAGRPAQLTPREFRLLRELVQHRDRTLSHDDLLGQVWSRGAGEGRTPEVLKQYVWRLRQKIEPDPNEPTMIVTEPGAGYRFVSHGG